MVAFGPRFVSCALPVRKYTNTNKNTNTHMHWDMANRVAFGRRFVSFALPERKVENTRWMHFGEKD